MSWDALRIPALYLKVPVPVPVLVPGVEVEEVSASESEDLDCGSGQGVTIGWIDVWWASRLEYRIIWVSRPRKRSTLAASHGVLSAGADSDSDPDGAWGKVARILAVGAGWLRPCWIRRRREIEWGRWEIRAGMRGEVMGSLCW